MRLLDWWDKLLLRVRAFKPGCYGIILVIDDKHGVSWTVQELGKVER